MLHWYIENNTIEIIPILLCITKLTLQNVVMSKDQKSRLTTHSVILIVNIEI